ncbi:MAG: tetratricopeptide repeat protein [Elusimicrobiota bacterium]
MRSVIIVFILSSLIGCGSIASPPLPNEEVTKSDNLQDNAPEIFPNLKFELDLIGVYIAKDEHEKALERLISVQENFPENDQLLKPLYAQTYLALAKKAEESKLWKETINYYRKAILADPTFLTSLSPKLAEAYARLALNFIRQNELTLATEVVTEGLNVFPLDKELLQQLGKIYLALKKYDEANKTYALILKNYPELKPEIAPQLAKISLSQANNFLKMENYEKALAAFSLALSLDPGLKEEINKKLVLIYYRLGNYYCDKKFFVQAEDQWQNALQLDEGNQQVREALGSLYLLQRRFDLAKQIYQKLLNNYPDQLNYNFVLGNIFWLEENYPQAIDLCQKILMLNEKKYFSIYQTLGNYYFAQKEYLLASQQYTKYLSFSENADVLFNRGLIFAALGSYAKALKDYNKAVNLDSSLKKRLSEYGWVFKFYRSGSDLWIVIAGAAAVFLAVFSLLLILRRSKRLTN